MKNAILKNSTIFLKGIAMGAADVVPGVSGGTIAFVSGIYQELISSINSIDFSVLKTLRKQGFKAAFKQINGAFLLPLFLGIITSILSLAKAIKWLLEHKPIMLWSFFFGLVLASIFLIGKQIKNWKYTTLIPLVVASIVSYGVTIMEPVSSADSLPYLFFCGFLAIIAMILPGISGSFILLLLGAYQTAIGTIAQITESIAKANYHLFIGAFTKIAVLGLGAIVGLKVFSKALTWMFTKHKNSTLAVLTGFMIGSLNKLWPWKKVLATRIDSHGKTVTFLDKSILPNTYNTDPELITACLAVMVGFLSIFILEKAAKK